MWRKIAEISWGERRALVRAGVVVAAARVALRVLPLHWILHLIARRRVRERDPADAAGREARAVWALAVVSRRLPGTTCLASALAATALLDRAGRPARLQLGVRRDAGGLLHAHAWAEAEGDPVFGAPDGHARLLAGTRRSRAECAGR